MLRKLYTTFVLVPLGILLVVFAVANRHDVAVSLDPFGANSPALSVAMPLFVLMILTLLIGVLLGGLATWLSQGKWRRETRRLGSQVRAMRIEREALKAQIAARESALVANAGADSAAGLAPAGRETPALPAPLHTV